MRASSLIRDVTIKAESVGVTEAAAAADKLGAAVDGAAAANDSFSKSTLSVDRALDRVRRQIDESYRQSKQFEAGQRTLDRALEASRITTAEYERDLALLSTRFGVASGATDAVAKAAEDSARGMELAARANDNFKRSAEGSAKATGLARHELVNLSRQVQDIGVSLASGQSPMTVLIQQGTQVADIFASSQGSLRGFFGQVLGGAARFATSAAGMATGLLAIGAASAYASHQYAEGQREVEIALLGVGRASGLTVDGINKVAEAVARNGNISRSTAREFASLFAGTGRIDSSLITPGLLDSATKGFSVLTGQSQRDAAQALAQAIASPSAGAAELEKRLGSLDDAQRQFIRNSEAAGNRTAAQKALFDAFNPTLQEAATKTNWLAKAWENVSNWASNAADNVGKAIAGSTTLDDRIGKLREQIANRQSWGLGTDTLQAELDPLLRQRRANREAQDSRTADARAAELSSQAGDVLRSIFSDKSGLQNLRNQKELLEKIFGDSSAMAKLGALGPKVSEGIERLNSSIEHFETAAQRAANDNALQIQSINAYTLAQKVAVEMERARIEAIRAGRGELQAGVEAEQARSRVIAEANRQLRDTARDLKEAGGLIGLSPFARSLQEARNQSRREGETLGGAGAYRGNLTRDQLLDLIEQKESGGRNVPNYKFGPGFTAQGHFQITNSTWRDIARTAGIDLGQYPNAMSAPYAVQRSAANALIDTRGVQPWAPHNPALRAALGGAANDNGGVATNAAAREANVLREAYEGWNTPLANSERQLQASSALLKRQAESMFASAEETAKAAEKQRLLNEYAAQGIPITAGLAAQIDRTAAGYGAFARQTEELQRMQDTMRTIGDLGKDALKGFVSDLRAGKSAGEAMQNVLNRLIDKLLEMAINDMFGKAFGGSGGGGFWGSVFKFIGGGFGGVSAGPTPISSGTGGLYANGGVFGPGGLHPFALGGAFTNSIVSRPTLFPFANGTGLMGEAGPEAIMPLRRGRDGRLGVAAAVAAAQPAAEPARVSFSLINNGRPVEIEATQEMPDGRGGRRVEVVLNEAVGKAISEPGAARDAMQNSYGARQRVARR